MTLEQQLRASLCSEDKPTIEADDSCNSTFADNHDLTQQSVDYEKKAAYESDKRWGKHWRTPEDIYNSLMFEEKNNKPIITALQQRNIKDADGLARFLQQYDEYENPLSDKNLVYNSMKNIISNPALAEKMRELFNESSAQQISKKWGDLPEEVLQRLKVADELEKKQSEREWIDTVKYYEGVVSQEVDKISDICEKYNIKADISDFLNYYKKTGNTVSNLYDHFISRHFDEINRAVQERASANTLKNLANASKSSIQTSSEGKNILNSGEKIRTISELRKYMLEALKGD